MPDGVKHKDKHNEKHEGKVKDQRYQQVVSAEEVELKLRVTRVVDFK